MGSEWVVLVCVCLSSSIYLLLPVVWQWQMVISAVGLLVVVHERVQIRKIAVQINFPGVPSTHQVAVELWTLLTRIKHIMPFKSACRTTPVGPQSPHCWLCFCFVGH